MSTMNRSVCRAREAKEAGSERAATFSEGKAERTSGRAASTFCDLAAIAGEAEAKSLASQRGLRRRKGHASERDERVRTAQDEGGLRETVAGVVLPVAAYLAHSHGARCERGWSK
ncbi:hypothetical protein BJY59DRAFT_695730 [Rhodotorula toruloides]